MHSYTEYFKKQKGFDRFINKLYLKYKSLAKFSGTIKLDNLSSDEANAMGRFFGVNYTTGESINVSIKKFLNIMENSRFSDFDINVLVEEYLDVKLITNKEESEILKSEEEAFYHSIIEENMGIGGIWLKHIVKNKDMPYRLFSKRYNKNKYAFKKELTNIIRLINNLPNEKTLLPIFAAINTKDPHYLDIDNNHSIIFFYALSGIDKSCYPISRKDKIELLSKYNIEIDSISNFAITYNLISDKDYINMFANNHETLILNIQNIININYLTTRSGKVFIIENPSILTEIVALNIDASVIIADGFPNTSVHLLIEKLIESGNTIYYNGDFDPEGLLIANKLKEKYSDNLVLFCYEKIDYDNCMSKSMISEMRLKKLSKINADELSDIKSILINSKYSAYQENNKDRIINFIKNNG